MNDLATNDQFERAIADAESLFEMTAEARGEAENADERKKHIKAVMFIKFKDEGSGAGEAEQRAIASAEYKAASDDWMSANITWRRLEGKARAKELRFEAWRTANATERAKMRLR